MTYLITEFVYKIVTSEVDTTYSKTVVPSECTIRHCMTSILAIK